MIVALLFALALQTPPPHEPTETYRQVWLTNDSAPGWQPSEALEAEVRATLTSFLDAIDHGRYAEAFAMQDGRNQKALPLDRFSASQREFRNLAGSVLLRQVNRITWTKNPQDAPAPGIYAAIDLTSRFTNVDRHCGYVILYQAPEGGPFKVMRQENNFLDNKTAHSGGLSRAAAVDSAWAQLTTHCPNYRPPPGGTN